MKKNIQVRMSEKDIERLKKEAGKSGHTISSLVRHIILEFLKRLGVK